MNIIIVTLTLSRFAHYILVFTVIPFLVKCDFAAMFTNLTDMATWNESDLMKYIEFLKHIELGQEIILIFIAILTTLGNSVVLIATCREKDLHQPNKYFIAFLAVADLFVGMFLAPLKVYQLSLGSEARRNVSIHLCRFMVWIDTFALATSILTLAFISFDRYLKIRKPLQYKARMTTSRSLKIIVIIWLISTAFASFAASPYSGSYGIVLMNSNLKYCPGDKSKEKGFYTFLSVAFIFFTVIILVMYTLIFVVAHERQIMLRNGQLGQTWNGKNQRSVFRQDLKVIRTLVVVLGVFILCWFPFVIFNLLELYDPSSIDWDSTSLNYQYSIHISRTIVGLLPLLNSLCNPIIYSCLDRKYREAFKSLFQRIMCRP